MGVRGRLYVRRTLAERLSDHVVPCPLTGCLWWLGNADRNGYGLMRRGGKREGTIYTHIVAYRAHVGEVPDGYVIDHLCRQPLCCEPAHLEAVPIRQNIRRGLAAKLSEADVVRARGMRSEGASVKGIAARFGISESQMSRVLRGLHWAVIDTAEVSP